MPRYEYKVVPAPTKGQKAKGVKTPEGRFALSVQSLMNQLGAEGWEYLRADLLPSEERSGLTGTAVKWRNLLVFRRAVAEAEDSPVPELLAAPEAGPEAGSPPRIEPPAPRPATGAEVMLKDNGVEEPSDVAGMTESLRMRAAQQDEAAQTEAPETPEGTEAPETDDGKPG